MEHSAPTLLEHIQSVVVVQLSAFSRCFQHKGQLHEGELLQPPGPLVTEVSKILLDLGGKKKGRESLLGNDKRFSYTFDSTKSVRVNPFVPNNSREKLMNILYHFLEVIKRLEIIRP